MNKPNCPEELARPPQLPGVSHNGRHDRYGSVIPGVTNRYGSPIVRVTDHVLPKTQGTGEGHRAHEIRYDVVDAFINHAEAESNAWQKQAGVMNDRPRLENAFQTTADRQDISIERVKQACRIGYDPDDTKNKLEQLLVDLLRIETCVQKMTVEERE